MSWWVYTDPSSTGTCERCKRSAAEHTWVCIACATALHASVRLPEGRDSGASARSYARTRRGERGTSGADVPRRAHPSGHGAGSCERGGPRRWSGTPRSTGDGASSERTSVRVLGLRGLHGGYELFSAAGR